MALLLIRGAGAPLSWGPQLGVWESATMTPGQTAWLEEPLFCVTLLVTGASLCDSPVRLLDLYSVHKP